MLTFMLQRLVGLIASLPPAWQRRLAGGRTVQLDGQELEPEVQLALALLALTGAPGVETMTPTAGRADLLRSSRLFSGPPLPLDAVDMLTVPGPAGGIPARRYRADQQRPARDLIVFFHGGGWVVGDLDSHDALCRFLARTTDAIVLAIDYRRAPEHHFPAAPDDAFAAFQWAVTQAARWGCDPQRVIVAGDSAGGNLATVVALDALRHGGPQPVAQFLIYPVTDLSTRHRSYELFARGFLLTAAAMDWYRSQYLPSEAAALDPRASPLTASELRGLAPAVVLTAGCDVLRDEGEAYAARLSAAGVPVRHRRFPGLIHGFANAAAASPTAGRAMSEAVALLRELLPATVSGR